jgi:Ca2+-binding RTX toxin-like protein
MINEIQFHDGTVISFNDIVNSLARRLYGTDQQDSIYGSADSEELYGFGGADHIRGLDGDDRIDGGAGNDGLLSGGRGSDTYLFNLGNGTDTIFDSYLESGPVNPLDKDVVEMGRHIDPSQIFVFLADDGLHLEVAFEDQIILRDEKSADRPV